MDTRSSVVELLEARSEDRPDHVALVDSSRSMTFLELYRITTQTCSALIHLGVSKGDRIGVCMSKSIEQVIALIAILRAGAIAVPILPSLKRDNILHIITNCGMSVVITDEARLQEVACCPETCSVIIGKGEATAEHPNLPYISQHLNPVERNVTLDADDLGMIIYSSGSTGRPKGIMITHKNLVDGAEITKQYLTTLPSDRIGGLLSLNFDYGLNQLWQTLLVGCTLCLHEPLLPNDTFRFIEEYEVTALPLMPVLIERLFDARLLDHRLHFRLEKVRYITSSGGRVAPWMLNKLRTTFPVAQIFLMYGLTEAFRSTYLPPDQLEKRPNSIGIPVPNVEVFVIGPDGRECEANVTGELVHRGGCVSKGYWNDPELTREKFRGSPKFPGELLVHSGDMVRRDKEGFLYFIGREDGQIKNMGIRISPTEIETQAELHEDIRSTVVFGIDNQVDSQEIVLCYTSFSGQEIKKQSLFIFLKKHLPAHMIPHHIQHFLSFPATGNQGKVDREAVRDSVRIERIRSSAPHS